MWLWLALRVQDIADLLLRDFYHRGAPVATDPTDLDALAAVDGGEDDDAAVDEHGEKEAAGRDAGIRPGSDWLRYYVDPAAIDGTDPLVSAGMFSKEQLHELQTKTPDDAASDSDWELSAMSGSDADTALLPDADGSASDVPERDLTAWLARQEGSEAGSGAGAGPGAGGSANTSPGGVRVDRTLDAALKDMEAAASFAGDAADVELGTVIDGLPLRDFMRLELDPELATEPDKQVLVDQVQKQMDGKLDRHVPACGGWCDLSRPHSDAVCCVLCVVCVVCCLLHRVHVVCDVPGLPKYCTATCPNPTLKTTFSVWRRTRRLPWRPCSQT